MSSVGSSDGSSSSSGSGDVVRRNREDYEKKEAELVKKQAKEIRRLNEQHYDEVEKLKNDYQAQMDDLRKRTGQDINHRDHKYQKDMEDMRGLYRKQLQTQADNNQSQSEALRKSTKNDLEAERTNANQRNADLTDQYEKSLNRSESQFHDGLEQARAAQAQALQDNHDKLQRHYDKETDAVKKERNQRVGGLQKSFNDYRQATTQRDRDMELRHFQEQQRSSDNLIRAVNKARLAQHDQEEYLRQGFNDGLNAQRERYDKQMAREREAASLSRDQLRSTVGNRIDNQVNRLKREKEDLKDSNVRAQLQMEQDKRHEVGIMADAYRKNMLDFQDQKERAVKSANDRVHKNSEHIRAELGKQAVETNRYYRSEEDLQNRVHRQAYDQQKRDNEVRQAQIKDLADQRVKKLYDINTEDKARMTALAEENHEVSQRSQEERLKALRSAMETDKQIAVNNLQEHLQKQELAHSERMAAMVSKYEKQIQQLKDQLAREEKRSDENLKRYTEEMQRQNQMSIDQVESKNRNRMEQIQQQHSEELRALNKRHEERLDQVLSEVKKA